MIRIVVDTNVIVSALLWGGQPRIILNAARRQMLEIAISQPLIHELEDVLARGKFQGRIARTSGSLQALLGDGFLEFVTIVDADRVLPVVLQDPDDDAVIACAIAAQADYIISGDRHLLSLQTYHDIAILTVGQFVNSVMPTLL